VTVAFSAISYGKPAADVFSFTPPQGTRVETQSVAPQNGSAPPQHLGQQLPVEKRPTVIGSGWNAIVELPAGSADLAQLSSGATPAGGTDAGGTDAGALLGLLQAVPGGRGAQTALVSVLITADGRVLAGAVPLTALENAAR
jgi:hypothetical protein